MSNEEIFQTMKDLVAEQFAMEPEEVTMETSFEEDLGADSVDLPQDRRGRGELHRGKAE